MKTKRGVQGRPTSEDVFLQVVKLLGLGLNPKQVSEIVGLRSGTIRSYGKFKSWEEFCVFKSKAAAHAYAVRHAKLKGKKDVKPTLNVVQAKVSDLSSVEPKETMVSLLKVIKDLLQKILAIQMENRNDFVQSQKRNFFSNKK